MPKEKRTFDRLGILTSGYVVLFVLAPFLSNRIIEVFGAKLLVGSIGMILSYGLLDIINEVFGRRQAQETVLTAAVIRVLVWIFIAASFLLPTFQQPVGFDSIMQSSLRILIAGEISLVLTQYFIDVPLFDWLKQRIKYGFWARYNISNMMSQSLLFSIFIVIAFFNTGKPLGELILWGILLRIFISILFTPIFVVITTWMKK